MDDKYAKKIAKELELIRVELKKINQPTVTSVEVNYDEETADRAGDRITIE